MGWLPLEITAFPFEPEQPLNTISPVSSPVPSPLPPLQFTPTRDEQSQPASLLTPEPAAQPEFLISPTPQEPTQPQEPLETEPESKLPDSTFLLSRLDFGPWDHVLALDWSPDGSLLAVSAGEKVHLLLFPSMEFVHEIQVGASTESLAISRAASAEMGDLLLLALAVKDGSIQLWDADRGELLCSFTGHRNGSKSLAFTPDGLSLATSGMDAMVKVWNLAAFLDAGACPPPLQAELIGGARAVPEVAIHPDGNFLASIDLRQIRLREIASQRIIGTIQVMEPSYVISFNPDGSWLVGGLAGDSIRIWEVETLAVSVELKPIEPPQSTRVFTWSLAFHPSGKWLAAGSSTGLVRIWHLEGSDEDRQIQLLEAHQKAASSLAFHPFENVLVSGGLDGHLLFWSFIP